jgi:peptidoglycan-N-acetylglucosamine deacetylase
MIIFGSLHDSTYLVKYAQKWGDRGLFAAMWMALGAFGCGSVQPAPSTSNPAPTCATVTALAPVPVASSSAQVVSSPVLASSAIAKKEVAITIDDLPLANFDAHKTKKERQAIVKRLCERFQKRNIPVTGFFNMKYHETDPTLVPIWKSCGITMGNHTYSHPRLRSVGLEKYLKDLSQGHAMVQAEVPKGTTIPFRYPYLYEGFPDAERQAVAKHLKTLHSPMAPVTIDTIDFYYTGGYSKAKKAGQSAQMKHYVEAWQFNLKESTELAEDLAWKLFEQYPPQILLIHGNEINSDHIEWYLDWLKEQGYSFVSLEEALKHAAYREPQVVSSPTGDSLWLRLRRSREKRFGVWKAKALRDKKIDPLLPEKLAFTSDQQPVANREQCRIDSFIFANFICQIANNEGSWLVFAWVEHLPAEENIVNGNQSSWAKQFQTLFVIAFVGIFVGIDKRKIIGVLFAFGQKPRQRFLCWAQTQIYLCFYASFYPIRFCHGRPFFGNITSNQRPIFRQILRYAQRTVPSKYANFDCACCSQHHRQERHQSPLFYRNLHTCHFQFAGGIAQCSQHRMFAVHGKITNVITELLVETDGSLRHEMILSGGDVVGSKNSYGKL